MLAPMPPPTSAPGMPAMEPVIAPAGAPMAAPIPAARAMFSGVSLPPLPLLLVGAILADRFCAAFCAVRSAFLRMSRPARVVESITKLTAVLGSVGEDGRSWVVTVILCRSVLCKPVLCSTLAVVAEAGDDGVVVTSCACAIPLPIASDKAAEEHTAAHLATCFIAFSF